MTFAMEWVFAILLLVGLFVLFLVAIWFVHIAYWHLLYAFNSLGEDFHKGTAWMADNLQRRTEKRKMERRFATVAGASSEVDWEAVEARRQIPVLRRLFAEDLPAAIVRCIRIHRFAAHTVGADYIGDIADDPECAGSRQRVIALAEAGLDVVERYPYLVENEKLMVYGVALRARVLPTCRNCPYLKHEVAYAPLLCPTAETFHIDPERCRDNDEA